MKAFIGICLCILVHVKAETWQITSYEITTANEKVFNVEEDELSNGTNYYRVMIKESIDDGSINISSMFEYNSEVSAIMKGSICVNDTVTDLGSIASIVRMSMSVECPIAPGNYSTSDKFNIDAFIPGVAEIAGGQIPQDTVYLHTRATRAKDEETIFKATYEILKIK